MRKSSNYRDGGCQLWRTKLGIICNYFCEENCELLPLQNSLASQQPSQVSSSRANRQMQYSHQAWSLSATLHYIIYLCFIFAVCLNIIHTKTKARKIFDTHCNKWRNWTAAVKQGILLVLCYLTNFMLISLKETTLNCDWLPSHLKQRGATKCAPSKNCRPSLYWLELWLFCHKNVKQAEKFWK